MQRCVSDDPQRRVFTAEIATVGLDPVKTVFYIKDSYRRINGRLKRPPYEKILEELEAIRDRFERGEMS